MKRTPFVLVFARFVALAALLVLCTHAQAQTDALPSWNDGPAKQAILEFVWATTDQSSPTFVPPEARIATFDQDGTLWVEHPITRRCCTAWSGSRGWRQ